MIDLKPYTIAPLTGLLDDRSRPDLMPKESFRRILNWHVPEANKLSRRPGWTKLLSKETGYNNEDLHDQMLAAQTYYIPIPGSGVDPNTIDEWPSDSCDENEQLRTTGRQPITLLFQAESTTGMKKLIAATESRVYAVNENKGTWKLLGDGYGTNTTTAPAYRFYAAQCLNMVILTNNYNLPLSYMFDQKSVGCNMQALSTITDCEVIGLRRAAVVWVWRDVVFFANVEMDGQRYRHRMVWSDYQNPLSLDPSKPESIAAYQDLEYGEEILGGLPMGDIFLVYTNRRIWQIEAVGGDQVFSVTKRYNPTKNSVGEGVLAYRNTLVMIGDSHVYMGVDGIYEYDLYTPAPKRVDWIHLGTNQVFSTINETLCDAHIGVYNIVTKELWFSWVEDGAGNLPSKTIAINKQFQHVSTIDYGFSAFAMYQPNYLNTIRDFALQYCACTQLELDTYGYKYIKEGLPLAELANCVSGITCIYSTTDITVSGAVVEDFNQARPSAGSLCEALLEMKIDDFCPHCATAFIMVMASSTDYCLKQVADVYYRETCTNPTAIGTVSTTGYINAVATYSLDGYDSILNGKPESFGQPKLTKQVDRIDIEAAPVTQLVPSNLELRTGSSEQAIDPVIGGCPIMWTEQDPLSFECLDGTIAENVAASTRPNEPFAWSLFDVGKFFHWELKISGTGGAGEFSAVNIYPRPISDI